MSDPYVGEIRMFGGTYAPQDWHFCDGSLLNISEYNALFALLGTTYGGNGTTNFALPDLRGRLPIGQGQGPGLTDRVLGELDGKEEITLTVTQMPAHNHLVMASTAAGTQASPQNGVLASPVSVGGSAPGTPINEYITIKTTYTKGLMDPQAIGTLGGSQPHDNMMSSLPLSFIIALQGEWPEKP